MEVNKVKDDNMGQRGKKTELKSLMVEGKADAYTVMSQQH